MMEQQDTWKSAVHKAAEGQLAVQRYVDVLVVDAQTMAQNAWDGETTALQKEARLARIRRELQSWTDAAGRRTLVATQIDIFGEQHHVYKYADDAAKVEAQRTRPRAWWVSHLVHMVRRIPLSFLPLERANALIQAVYDAFREEGIANEVATIGKAIGK